MSRILSALRDLVPLRALSKAEAMRVAERQAQRLLKLTGIKKGPVPETIITDLTHVEIKKVSPAPVSGATHWKNDHWLIVINAAEPQGRQRFSLMHEAKHILDSRFIDYLYPSTWGQSSHQRAEQICNYFAACVLMPKEWVKKAWDRRRRPQLHELAQEFEVTPTAMHVRLQQLGFISQPTRCDPPVVASGRHRWNERRKEGQLV